MFGWVLVRRLVITASWNGALNSFDHRTQNVVTHISNYESKAFDKYILHIDCIYMYAL